MTSDRCASVREQLRALQAGRLSSDEGARVRAHLAECETCRARERAERALTELLETRLARPQAPASLRDKLRAMTAADQAPSAPSWRVRARKAVPVLTALAAAAAALLFVQRPSAPRDEPLVREVVNDHLRVLYAERPIEIESGGIHQVKPWFQGRIDFAPRVPFGGDAEFPLIGGAVGYVLDRKAATFVFKRRLHTITLLVFPADDLPWPKGAEVRLPHARAEARSVRGFNVLLFQHDDLGYALVSDLNQRELSLLADKLAE